MYNTYYSLWYICPINVNYYNCFLESKLKSFIKTAYSIIRFLSTSFKKKKILEFSLHEELSHWALSLKRYPKWWLRTVVFIFFFFTTSNKRNFTLLTSMCPHAYTHTLIHVYIYTHVCIYVCVQQKSKKVTLSSSTWKVLILPILLFF